MAPSAKVAVEKVDDSTTAVTAPIRTATVNTKVKQQQQEAEAAEVAPNFRETIHENKIILVEDDYFAIEKVVDWRGEGRHREYRIRWQGLSPDADDWLKPSALCEDTLREAQSMVRNEKRKMRLLEMERTQPLKARKPKATTSTPEPKAKNSKPTKASTVQQSKSKPGTTQRAKADKSKSSSAAKANMKKLSPKVTTKKMDIDAKTKATSKHVATKQSKTAKKKKQPEIHDLTMDSLDNGRGRKSTSDRRQHTVAAKQKKKRKGQADIHVIDLTGDEPKRKKAKVQRNVKDAEDSPPLDPEEWKRRELERGNDIEMVDFQPIERIDINDASAKKKVSDARMNGIPIVLTGYLGWPEFASRWIKGAPANKKVDFSQGVELDIEKMIADIGKEEVPIVEKNYDESNPASNVIKAAVFLNNYWPKKGVTEKKKKKLYLQQWQFSSSERASKILCGPDKCSPPPPSAFYEDLLPFWLSEGGNPYQYLFMGDSGTMSKLHKDPGGLEILIAPIIGEKECILGHRDDGAPFLYNLQSKLDSIDLVRFPMTAFARVWKTVVKPGEILVMPHDTYHQCRNVTPCLSYHRLHLDVVNLRGFIQSMYAGDAKELEHTEVIWNTSHGLMARVDEYVRNYKASAGNSQERNQQEGEAIAETVHLLRRLNAICLGIVRFLESSAASKRATIGYSDDDWIKLVTDIGQTLHEYRYRDASRTPRYRPPTLVTVDADCSDDDDDEMKAQYSGRWRLSREMQVFKTAMDNLPAFKPEDEDLVLSDTVVLKAGDEVQLRLNHRMARGTVEKVITNKKGLFIRYDALPACFDEYHPRDKVQSRTETIRHLVSTALRPALDMTPNVLEVQCIPSCGPAELQSGIVVSSRTGTFYLVKITLDSKTRIQRMLSRESIVRKVSR